jgi:hypothetical protein
MKKKLSWFYTNPNRDPKASVQNSHRTATEHPFMLSEAELRWVSGGGGHAGGVADAVPTITTTSVTTVGGTTV